MIAELKLLYKHNENYSEIYFNCLKALEPLF